MAEIEDVLNNNQELTQFKTQLELFITGNDFNKTTIDAWENYSHRLEQLIQALNTNDDGANLQNRFHAYESALNQIKNLHSEPRKKRTKLVYGMMVGLATAITLAIVAAIFIACSMFLPGFIFLGLIPVAGIIAAAFTALILSKSRVKVNTDAADDFNNSFIDTQLDISVRYKFIKNNGLLFFSKTGYLQKTEALTLSRNDMNWPSEGKKQQAKNSKRIIIKPDVEEIPENTFTDFTHLTQLRLSDNLNQIRADKFIYRASEIYLPQGLRSIGARAFQYCTSLREIYLPNELHSIEYFAFNNCTSLREIYFPEGLQSIGDSAFEGCTSLTEIYFPEGLQSMGNAAFLHCTSLTKIYLPKGLHSINYRAFEYCTSLREIHFHDGLFPDGLRLIDDHAFEGCTSLTEIHLPKTLQSIGNGAFYNCTSLTEIHLPETLQSIGNGAFYNCNSLNKIYINTNNPNEFDRIKSLLPERLQEIAEQCQNTQINSL